MPLYDAETTENRSTRATTALGALAVACPTIGVSIDLQAGIAGLHSGGDTIVGLSLASGEIEGFETVAPEDLDAMDAGIVDRSELVRRTLDRWEPAGTPPDEEPPGPVEAALRSVAGCFPTLGVAFARCQQAGFGILLIGDCETLVNLGSGSALGLPVLGRTGWRHLVGVSSRSQAELGLRRWLNRTVPIGDCHDGIR